jgi:MoxR-like ATPase
VSLTTVQICDYLIDRLEPFAHTTAELSFLLHKYDFDSAVNRSSALKDISLIKNFVTDNLSKTFLSKRPIVLDANKALAALRKIKSSPPENVKLDTAPTSSKNDVSQSEQTGATELCIDSLNAANDPNLKTYVKTSSFADVQRQLKVKNPVNVYVYGETGLGKTTSILSAAKQAGRVVIRVPISYFTEVDDLFGGLRLVNGTMVYNKGPAVLAMELGAILLLDELDRINPQVATELFPVLEHRGYLIKKLNKMVYPTTGFCVFATGNSRGKGDLTGKYNTQLLDSALLDRFEIAISFDPPTEAELVNIIQNSGYELAPTMVECLAAWHKQIQTSYEAGAVTDVISTRKVLTVAKTFANNNVKEAASSKAYNALRDSLSILDDELSEAFIQLWKMMAKSPTSGEEQCQPGASAGMEIDPF